MIALVRMVLRLVADLTGLLVFAVKPRLSIEAENLVLRRQLALFNLTVLGRSLDAGPLTRR